MTANLRILQLNIMKSRAGMEALINDHQSQNLDLLLIPAASLLLHPVGFHAPDEPFPH